MRKILWLLLFFPLMTGFTWSANMKGTWKGQGTRTVGGHPSEGSLEVTLVLTEAPTVAAGGSQITYQVNTGGQLIVKGAVQEQDGSIKNIAYAGEFKGQLTEDSLIGEVDVGDGGMEMEEETLFGNPMKKLITRSGTLAVRLAVTGGLMGGRTLKGRLTRGELTLGRREGPEETITVELTKH